MKLTMVTVALFVLAGPFNAQDGIVFPNHDIEKVENNFFWYNEHLAVFHYFQPYTLDTVNYCRVKRNRIKSVEIWQHYPQGKTRKISTVEYDRAGLDAMVRREVDTTGIKCIPCDSIYPFSNVENKRTRYRDPQQKMIWKTDSLGYVSEYRFFHRGFFRRIIIPMTGWKDHMLKYTYNSTYTSVTVTRYEKRYFHIFNRWEKQHDCKWTYTLDANDNLVSEFTYQRNAEGCFEIIEGYSYFYEYY